MQNKKSFSTFLPARLQALDGFTVFLVALSISSAILVLMREVTHGVGLGYDSMHYISGANKLLDGNFFFGYTAFFPPLYPILLALTSFSVLDPRDVAGPLNAAAFGLTVYIAGQWLRNRVESHFLVTWGCFAVALSIPLANIASKALSEAIFVLFSILALTRIDKFLNTNLLSHLVWAALYTALACMTRYAGITLIITIVLLLFFYHNLKLTQSIRRIFTFLLIALTPLGLWLLRNLVLTGTLTGHRGSSVSGIQNILEQINEVVSKWVFPDLLVNRIEALIQRLCPYIPPGTMNFIAEALTGFGMLALIIATAYGLSRLYKDTKSWNKWGPFYSFGTFSIVYTIFMTTTWLIYNIEPPTDRMLCPVYIPLLFITVFTMDRLIRYEQERKLSRIINDWPIIRSISPAGVNIASGILIIVLCFWLILVVKLNVTYIGQSDTGRYSGFAAPRWTHSETIQYLQRTQIDGVVYTSGPATIYFNLPGQKVTRYPFHVPREMYSEPTSLNIFFLPRRWQKLIQRIEVEDATTNEAHIVWFYGKESLRSRDYSPQQLGALPSIETVAELSDGVIFRLRKQF